MNQEPRVMETNSLFEVWRLRLGKLARHWKVTAGAGDSQGGEQGRELTGLQGLSEGGVLLSVLPSCPSTLCEKRTTPQCNPHPLPAETQGKALPDHASRLTWVSWTRIYS